MRRGKGRLTLVLVVLLVVVIAMVALYLYLTSRGGGTTPGTEILNPPTTVPKVRVLLARQVIPVNTIFTPDLIGQYVTAEERERTPELMTGGDLIGTESQLIDMVSRVEIQPGSILYANQFTKATLSYLIPKGKRAIPLEVDRFSGVVGKMAKGDYVDIIFSGQLELNYPIAFPPSAVEPPIMLSPVSLLSVKTILQDIEILEVIPLTSTVASAAQPGPTPTAAAAPVAEVPVNWILILAVDAQQAEILKFANDQQMTYQLLLRARDDHATATTLGITTQILVQTYGLPKPQLLRYDISAGTLPGGIVP
jgi:pilus assembly protein CpaB